MHETVQDPKEDMSKVNAAASGDGNDSGNMMMSVRLPFLVVPSHIPLLPSNLKNMSRVPSTPSTFDSMTPATSSYRHDLDDLDSQSESDMDDPSIPNEIGGNCNLQSLMSPLGMWNDDSNDDSGGGGGRVGGFGATLKSDSEQTSYSARIGIARPSYSPSQTYTDVSPILNSRNSLEKYTNASANPQYHQDQYYHEQIKSYNRTPNNYASNTPNGINIGSLGISVFAAPSTSTPYISPTITMSHHRAVNIDKDDDTSLNSYTLGNDRFITPGQAFIKKERSLPRRLTPEKGKGLAITPPPRTRSSRVLVQYVTPPSNDTYTIFILVIQPTAKLFELIRVNYHPSTATLGDLLDLVPGNVTEEDLRDQKHIGLCRPHGSSAASRSLTKLDMTASLMARDGTDARILCGEVLVAIPEGYTGKEAQILSQHILKIPKMKKLLQRADPLSGAENSGRRARRSGRSPMSSLGIQPMANNANTTSTGTFSSSVLFAPLSAAIHEDVEQVGVVQPRKDMIVPRNHAYHSNMDDDSSVDCSVRVGPKVSDVVATMNTNMRLSDRISPRKLSDRISPCNFFNRDSSSNPSPRSRRSGRSPSTTPDVADVKKQLVEEIPANASTGLSAEQLDSIKREAAGAARIAAEEAFAMRMEELVETLNISSTEKARILQEPCDVSFYSAFSLAAIPSFGSQDSFPSDVIVGGNKSSAVSTVMGASPSNVGPSFMEPKTPYSNGSADVSAFTVTPMPYIPPQDYASPMDSPRCPSPIAIDPEADYSNSKDGFQFDDTVDMDELFAKTMEGFLASTLNIVSAFVAKRKTRLRQLPGKVMKNKMALNVMSVVCVMFLTSQLMNEDEGGTDIEAAIVIPSAQPQSAVGKPFLFTDIQKIMFWFMFMVQGQNYVVNHKSKRKRRTWRSKVTAIK